MIYLDYAATTPVPKAVADAMYEVLTEQFGNPSAQYPYGADMKRRVEHWRETVAAALDCSPRQLFFTSCGTEGDNWAIQAALWQNRHVGRHIVTTAVEHSAILEACKWLELSGYEVTRISPDARGDITAEQILAAVRPDTALVSVMLVNNELGNVYPIADIAAGLHGKNPKTLLHTDAVQGFLKVPCSAKALGADFVSISGHKIGAAKGVGALYIGERVRNARPLLPGGGQESGGSGQTYGYRSGTEATAQLCGFAKAVELRTDNLVQKLEHVAAIRVYAAEKLAAIPDMQLLGSDAAPHILAAALVGWPSQNVVNDLGKQGICISAGSACHQGKPSHVVSALGLPPRVAKSVIRLSFGPETTPAEIDVCADALRRHHDGRMPML